MLYLEDLSKALKKEGLLFPDEFVKRIQIIVMQLFEEKGYNRSIMFKNGLLASVVVLKNYDEMNLHFLEAFIQSNHSGKPPLIEPKLDFANNTVCMNLARDNVICKEFNKRCNFVEGKKYPLCEIVYKSLREAVASG